MLRAAAEQGAYRTEQTFRGERLGQEVDIIARQLLRPDDIGGKTAHEQCLHPGAHPPDLFKGVPAVLARHDHIQDEKGDPVPVFPEPGDHSEYFSSMICYRPFHLAWKSWGPKKI
jgi:hypothetical protein